MLSIMNYKYGSDCISQLNDWYYGKNWPSVYIVYNSQKAYVGETLDAIRRTEQHLVEPEFKQFTDICFISSKTYNKSVVLDLEAFLIKYISADGSKELINGNAGIVDHNYFYKEAYEDDFREIWKALIERGIVKNTLIDIENSELYKYSPYKSLNREQMNALIEILKSITYINNASYNSIIQVTGGAGTGKTILAIYLFKLLNDLNKNKLKLISLDNEFALEIQNLVKNLDGIEKIGFVVPMLQLRETVKKVFDSIDGLDSAYVLTPEQVAGVNREYDLLIVDEAHRLYKRRNLPNNVYESFDRINKDLMGKDFKGKEQDYTQLDWIILNSKRQLLFYDSLQEIRHTDIGNDRFTKICEPKLYKTIELHSQMRCIGGNGYYEYVKKILEFSNLTAYDYRYINNYDIKLFDSIEKLYKAILEKDSVHGLCKIATGPGWSFQEKVTIEGKDYNWISQHHTNANMAQDDKTIWSIHKIQGFDLNYAGVVFGKEVYYDKDKKRVDVLRSEVKDTRAKPAGDDEAMRRYILNIYLTLMTRGILGTYIYAVDENLREYLKRFFK